MLNNLQGNDFFYRDDYLSKKAQELYSTPVLLGTNQSRDISQAHEVNLETKRNKKSRIVEENIVPKYSSEHSPWGSNYTINQLVEARLSPWISKGGITYRDIEYTEKLGGLLVVESNGTVYGSTRTSRYFSRAMKAYPNYHPKFRVVFHQNPGDWPNFPVRERNQRHALPLALTGSGYSEFLDIILPFAGRDAYGASYELTRTRLLQKGLGIQWEHKKNEVIWRGSVGCQVGCGNRGDLYFPLNHIKHCKDDYSFRSRRAKKNRNSRKSKRARGILNPNTSGRTTGCEISSVGKYHPRIQLVNISIHDPTCINARFTTLNEHSEVFYHYFKNPKKFMGARISEEELVTYRYVVNVQNNGFADRLWQLLSLGLIVFQEMHIFQEFYYEMLTPWVHFIPIKTDMSDLCEKVQWAKNNEEKSRIIGENARTFICEKFDVENINLYIAKLVHRTGELVSLRSRTILNDGDLKVPPDSSQRTQK